MERSEAIEILWNAAQSKPLFFARREEFEHNLDSWDIVTNYVDGIPTFITIAKGPDFHFESLGTGRRMTRKMIVDFLAPIIAKYGYAATKTPHEDVRQHRFNKALGFEVVNHDEYDTHYRISRVRGSKCQ